jgi:NADH-quinone oxidoreductase subunit J
MALAGKKLPAPLVPGTGYNPETVKDLGAVGAIAQPLFNEYLLAFELTSVLLLVAVAGAVVLGKRRDADAG